MKRLYCFFVLMVSLITSSVYARCFVHACKLSDGTIYSVERRVVKEFDYEFLVFKQEGNKVPERIASFMLTVRDAIPKKPRMSMVCNGETLWFTTEFGVVGDRLYALNLKGKPMVKRIEYPKSPIFQSWGIELFIVDEKLAVKISKNGNLYGKYSTCDSFFHDFVLLEDGSWREISDGIDELWIPPKDGLERDAYVLENIRKRNVARMARNARATLYSEPQAHSLESYLHQHPEKIDKYV